jgi:hypothetical protein
MTKEEEVAREDIKARLKKSNKKLWNSLSDEEKEKAVSKYYSLRSINYLKLDRVLEQNSTLRKDLFLLLFALVLGVSGNLFADVVSDFLKDFLGTINYNILVFVFFVGLVFLGFKEINKGSIEHLRENEVLENLLDLVNKDNNK